MLTVDRFDDLREALARIEDGHDKKDAGGTHSLKTNLRLQGGRRRRSGGAGGDKRSRGGRSKR